jgi:hypothetical protein
MYADEEEIESRCPVCGEPISYCQGHGEIGDPDGFWIMSQHNQGQHLYCDPVGCAFRASGEIVEGWTFRS